MTLLPRTSITRAAMRSHSMNAAAVEEAKVMVANRAQDAPVFEMAADPNQNCRGWQFDQSPQLGDQPSLARSAEVDERPRHVERDPVMTCHVIDSVAGEGDHAPCPEYRPSPD